jgi:hypothetical protein
MADHAALHRLNLIDLVLHDLAVEIEMFVGRRADEGDDDAFVIQTGEDGRCRVRLPDMSGPEDVERCVAEAQDYLSRRTGRSVPRCLVANHEHALQFRAGTNPPAWRCPTSEWICPLGEYEERSWPQLGVSLAPLLVHRMARRGLKGQWRHVGVRDTPAGPVFDIGVADRTDEVVASLAAAAAPLQVHVEEVHGPLPHRVPRPG